MKKLFAAILIFVTAFAFCACDFFESFTEAGFGENLDGALIAHFIDVGQGDSVFIELPGEKVMLIDGGSRGYADTVIKYIKKYKIDKIDYLVATHPHEDHIGGLPEVIKAFEIGQIYMPKAEANTKIFGQLLDSIEAKGLKIKSSKAGVNILDEGGLRIDIISPAKDSYSDVNDYSAVIKITYGSISMIFMGDASVNAENEITADVSADLLKVGHHGSSTSTSADFLKRVNPKYAVICVGKGNTYGHPTAAALNRLKKQNVEIYRTDINGSIIASSNGAKIIFSTQKGSDKTKSEENSSGKSK